MTTRKIRRRAGMYAVRVTVTRARETVSKGIETLPQARAGGMKAFGLLVVLGCDVAVYTPAPYPRHRL